MSIVAFSHAHAALAAIAQKVLGLLARHMEKSRLRTRASPAVCLGVWQPPSRDDCSEPCHVSWNGQTATWQSMATWTDAVVDLAADAIFQTPYGTKAVPIGLPVLLPMVSARGDRGSWPKHVRRLDGRGDFLPTRERKFGDDHRESNPNCNTKGEHVMHHGHEQMHS